jgi:ribosomal protein L7/L12
MPILIVAKAMAEEKEDAEAVKEQLERLGFKVEYYRVVSRGWCRC